LRCHSNMSHFFGDSPFQRAQLESSWAKGDLDIGWGLGNCQGIYGKQTVAPSSLVKGTSFLDSRANCSAFCLRQGTFRVSFVCSWNLHCPAVCFEEYLALWRHCASSFCYGGGRLGFSMVKRCIQITIQACFPLRSSPCV
jgi:hypothetical protein